MKKLLWIFGIGITSSLIFVVCGQHFELTGFGLAGLGVGILYILIGIVILFGENRKLARNFLLSGLLLILIGATTCTMGFKI